MEKVILKLIDGLDRAVYIKKAKLINRNGKEIRLDELDGSEYETENGIENISTEIIEMLEKELPNMLKYCKQTSISPEVELLIKLFEETVNKYGLTKDVSYSIGYYAVLTAYRDELYHVGINLDTLPALAERCKQWLYWLYKYYPKKEGDTAPRLKEMPRVLDTDQARKYFARAVEAGLMTNDYKWEKSKILLAVFCSKMSDKLDLGKGVDKNEMKRISWKPFEMLFEVKGLRGTLNDMQKTGQSPKGIEKVNGIFKD